MAEQSPVVVPISAEFRHMSTVKCLTAGEAATAVPLPHIFPRRPPASQPDRLGQAPSPIKLQTGEFGIAIIQATPTVTHHHHLLKPWTRSRSTTRLPRAKSRSRRLASCLLRSSSVWKMPALYVTTPRYEHLHYRPTLTSSYNSSILQHAPTTSHKSRS